MRALPHQAPVAHTNEREPPLCRHCCCKQRHNASCDPATRRGRKQCLRPTTAADGPKHGRQEGSPISVPPSPPSSHLLQQLGQGGGSNKERERQNLAALLRGRVAATEIGATGNMSLTLRAAPFHLPRLNPLQSPRRMAAHLAAYAAAPVPVHLPALVAQQQHINCSCRSRWGERELATPSYCSTPLASRGRSRSTRPTLSTKKPEHAQRNEVTIEPVHALVLPQLT